MFLNLSQHTSKFSLWQKCQTVEKDKYSEREIWKSGQLTNHFSCLWTLVESGVTLQPPQFWNELQEVCSLLLVLPSPCQGDLQFFLLLSQCIFHKQNLHKGFNLLNFEGGVLLLAAAPVADGSLPCHRSWRPERHSQVLFSHCSLLMWMFALVESAWLWESFPEARNRKDTESGLLSLPVCVNFLLRDSATCLVCAIFWVPHVLYLCAMCKS